MEALRECASCGISYPMDEVCDVHPGVGLCGGCQRSRETRAPELSRALDELECLPTPDDGALHRVVGALRLTHHRVRSYSDSATTILYVLECHGVEQEDNVLCITAETREAMFKAARRRLPAVLTRSL